jgi:hypothetical protein
VAIALLVLLAAVGAALTTAQTAQAATCSAAAVTLTPMHSPNGTQRPFYADFGHASTNHSGYVGYELTGASLGADVWIKLSGFTGGKLGLAASQSASTPVRATSQAGKPLVYAYLTATGATAVAQTFTVEVWNGKPNQAGSTQVCTATDGFSFVEDVIKAAANKITGIAISNSSPAIGGTFDVTATGNTGTMGAGLAADQNAGNGVFAMAPAMDDAWPADAFTLTGVRTTIGGTTYRDRLRIYPGSAAAGAYTSRYDFTVRATTSAATSVLPVQSIASGTQVKYTGTYPGTISQIGVPTLTVSLVKTATSIVGPPYHVTYQVLVANSASAAVTLDSLRDTPTPTGPANWTFDTGTATLGGSAMADPVLDTGSLVFGGPFLVPANGSIVFTYTLSLSATVTNSVVGTVGGITIGASAGTGNQVSVNPAAPIVTTATLPNATVGSAYSQTLTASGGTGTYTWTSGSLPAGLALVAATGEISGIPTSAGASTFTVTATDGTPASGSKSVTLTVAAALAADTTAPMGALTLEGGAALTSSTTLSLGLAATDAIGVVAYRVAEGTDCTSASWVAVASSTSFSGLTSLIVSAGDATKTVSVQYKDAAGNISTTSTQTIVLDTVKPTTTLTSASTSPVSGAFTVTATFSKSVTGFDASMLTLGNGSVSGFSGSGASYSFTVTPAADGTVTVDVAADTATDAAGNGNTAAARLSRVADSTAPTVAITSAALDPISTAFLVSVTFSETVTGFVAGDVAVLNGAVSGFTGSGTTYTFTVTPAVAGTVEVTVGAAVSVDGAGNGNVAATQLTRVYTPAAPAPAPAAPAPAPADPPVITIVGSPSPTSVDGTAAFSFATEGLASFTCSLDGAAFRPCSSPITLTGLAVSGHTFVIRALDVVGEKTSDTTYTWTVVAPVVTFSPLPDDPEENVTLSWTSTGAVTFTCALDLGQPTSCASAQALENLSDGEHTFTVDAHAAGGVTGSATMRWTSRKRIPKPLVLIIPKINATDMLGRPRDFRQSADVPRSRGPFTRKLQVNLHIPTPTGEDIDVRDVFISNYPDFREGLRYPIAADELYAWELLPGPSGDRPVYIRFDASPDAPVGEATIVLDQELPNLKPVYLRKGPTAKRKKAKAVAATQPIYCGAAPRRWLRLAGADRFSGLNALQIATDIKHPCAWRPYLPTISYRAPGKVIYLRIEDRVGNVSRWYRIVTK